MVSVELKKSEVHGATFNLLDFKIKISCENSWSQVSKMFVDLILSFLLHQLNWILFFFRTHFPTQKLLSFTRAVTVQFGIYDTIICFHIAEFTKRLNRCRRRPTVTSYFAFLSCKLRTQDRFIICLHWNFTSLWN